MLQGLRYEYHQTILFFLKIYYTLNLLNLDIFS